MVDGIFEYIGVFREGTSLDIFHCEDLSFLEVFNSPFLRVMLDGVDRWRRRIFCHYRCNFKGFMKDFPCGDHSTVFWTAGEGKFTGSPIDDRIVGAKPCHSDDHSFGSDVGDVVPFFRYVSAKVGNEKGFMSDGGIVGCVVGIEGNDEVVESLGRDQIVFNKGFGDVCGRSSRIKEGFNLVRPSVTANDLEFDMGECS